MYKGSIFKQMLRVLGNCSLLVDNAKKMVSKDFVPLAIQLIELINNNQDLDVLKYLIEVFSNLSSHTDSDFKMYLATMFKQGTVDMLITYDYCNVGCYKHSCSMLKLLRHASIQSTDYVRTSRWRDTPLTNVS